MAEYDLFKDPKFKKMFNDLPKEEQEQYKRQGKHIYEKDYVNIGNNDNLEDKLIESVAYISEGLKSGLQPRQLDKNELEVMRNIYGKLWYEKFGFESETQ